MSDVRDLVGPATNTSKDGDLQFWTYRSKATNPKEPMQNAGVRTQHVAVIAFDAQGVVIAASMHSIHDDPRSTNAEAASNPFDDVTVIIGETKIGALRQRFGRPAREVWNLNGQEQLIYKKRGGTQVQKVTFHFNSGYLAKVEK